MGKHIHTRIFFMVLAIILFFALGAGLTFSASSVKYVQYAAARDGEAIISMVEEIAENMEAESAGERTEKPEENQREKSKYILQKSKERMKEGLFYGKLLIFNSKYGQVYPEVFQDGELPDRLTQRCQKILKEGNGVYPETIEIGNEKWHLNYFVMDTDYLVRAKYFIAAVPVPDLGVLLKTVQRLLWGVLLLTAVIASALAWVISKSISTPLEKLCCRIQKAGDGMGEQIEEVYSLAELETVKEAYNRMEQKIKEKEEEKHRFFQNVSHDLKTPLAAITGYAQGISCGIMEDKQKAAEIILSESIRMTELVESILSLTKMDNQELELHLTEIDLVEFIDQCLEALRGIRFSCTIHFESEEQELFVETDSNLLERILRNIISNSLRYAKSHIVIQVKRTYFGAEIFVKDDGPGFEKADLPHIFERFYKGKGGKTGIGLSFVWSGVCYLGGSVQAGNLDAPEEGAYYLIEIPETFKI